MPSKRIIACLDVKAGRVVKGVQFEGHVDAGDPAELALRYRDEGADEIVIYDIAASAERRTIDYNWLARVAEDAAQGIPEKVALECHLGLGDAVVPFDEEQMGRMVKGLVANAAIAILATADGAGNAVVLVPRVVLKTGFTSRGVELSISDNRLGPTGSDSGFISDYRRLLQKLGGGFDVNDLRGQGATFTAWWPLNAAEQAAA